MASGYFYRMNVLYLSYDGLTDGLGRSQVLPYILGLEGLGHVSPSSVSRRRSGSRTGERGIRELISGRNIRWMPLMYTASPPILSTVYDVIRLHRLAKRLHTEMPFDLIHCRSYITSLVGLQMKHSLGVPFLFDMRAFYADERVDGGLWNLKNPVYRLVYDFFKRKEQQFLTHANCTVSLTERGRDIIHSWKEIPGQPVPIEVIPCCADLGHFSSENVSLGKKTKLATELGITADDLVLTYLGSVGTWYMLPEMMDFFSVLLRERPTAKFLFITHDDPAMIRLEAERAGVPAIRVVISPASREEVPTFLSLAHLAIFFIKPVFSKSGSSPTKHGEMLGMGLPVIANSGVGDVDSIITTTGTGLLVKDFSDENYEKVIGQINSLLSVSTESLTSASEKYYSLDEGVKRYDRVYHTIGR
jgi:glycosyltransferase involved in cell wall biosynthesis